MAVEHQRGRIDAIAQTGGFRAIVEDMTQMRITSAAQNFGTHHAMPGILLLADAVSLNGLPEAGPAAAGIKFRCGIEQRVVAARAAVYAIVMAIPVNAGKKCFGAALAAYLILLRGQFLTPRGIGFFQLVHK